MLLQDVNKLLLLAEAPILLVTLGLMAWGLRILSLSLGFALDPLSRSFILVPLDQPYSQVVVRTVTAYRISSVGPPTIKTYSSSLEIDGYHDPQHPSTKTIPESLLTLQGLTYGYDPTATRTYTVTETGIRPISHLVRPEAEADEDKRDAAPSPTAAPVLLPRETSHILQARQRVIRYDGDYTGYSLDQPFTSYADVTVNHGFGRYFFEAGINYVYTTDYAGYSPDDLKRIRALTAMMSIAFAAIVGRLACAVVYLNSLRRGKRSAPRPTLGLANLALTLLLLLTYIPFWSLYGSWTNRNATVQAADAEFQTDAALRYYDLEDLLQSSPWQGTTVALITFWTISIVTSLLLSLRVLLEGRKEDAAEMGRKG